VVLDFGGEQLEVAAEGFDRLYLTFNRIDLGEVLEQDEDDPDVELAWRDLAFSHLGTLLGAALAEVNVLENDFQFSPVAGGHIEAWLLGGLEFVFHRPQRALQLYNDLNQLGLTYEDPRSDTWRRRRLPKWWE
jgi:hypothetical protein